MAADDPQICGARRGVGERDLGSEEEEKGEILVGFPVPFVVGVVLGISPGTARAVWHARTHRPSVPASPSPSYLASRLPCLTVLKNKIKKVSDFFSRLVSFSVI
jgi:hypothetical protein